MGFSPNFLHNLKNSIDIVNVVRAHVKLQQRGQNHVGLCPFHQEKTPSFNVSPTKGTYYCFGCQEHGDAISFVQKQQGLSFTEAVEYLARMHGIPVAYQSVQDSAKQQDLRQRNDRLRKALTCALDHFCQALVQDAQSLPLVALARRWLDERAMNGDAIDQFQLGVADTSDRALRKALHAQGIVEQDWLDSGLYYKKDNGALVARFRGRLMFPIHDKRAQLVGFGARRLDDSLAIAKYINSPQTELFHKKTLLYGLHHARSAIHKSKQALLVEGYTDVIALHQNGFANAVAPLGTALNVDHIKTLWQCGTPKPTLCFDGDAAGLQAARKTAHAMLAVITPETSLQFIFLPDNEDPQSLLQNNKDAFQAILKTPQSLIDVLWQDAVAHYLPTPASQENPEARAQFKNHVNNLHQTIQNKTLQAQYRGIFYKKVGALLYPKKGQEKPSSSMQSDFEHHRRVQPSQTRLRNRHKRIIAYCLYHPQLISLYGEEFARVDFSSSGFAECAQHIIDSPESTHSEPAQLRAWLEQRGCHKALASLEEAKLRRECCDGVSFADAEQAFKDWLAEEALERINTTHPKDLDHAIALKRAELQEKERLVSSLDSR